MLKPSNTPKAKKFAKLGNVFMIKYFDLIRDDSTESVDESFHERLFVGILYKLGIPPKELITKLFLKLENFPICTVI